MLSRTTLIPLLLALLSVASAGSAGAAITITESGPLVGVTTGVTPGFSYETGIQIGSYLYVYLQGAGPTESCGGDHLVAYRALLDAHGHPGTFSRAGRISPCVEAPEGNSEAFYSPGQVFLAEVGTETQPVYHLLSSVSDSATFKDVWHATSTDGLHWTWEITVTGGPGPQPASPDITSISTTQVASSFISANYTGRDGNPGFVIAPVMLSTAPSTNNSAWWGFLNIYESKGNEFTPIQVTWSGSTPQVKLANSSFVYSPLTNNTITSLPYELRIGEAVSSLLYDPSTSLYQVFGNQFSIPWSGSNVNCVTTTEVTCPANTTRMCTDGIHHGCQAVSACVAPGDTEVAYPLNTNESTGSAFVWWNATRFSFGSDNQISSTGTDNPRYEPTGYSTGRLAPYVWIAADGTKYMYSGTNDANICSDFLFSPFRFMYVVQTLLTTTSS